MIVVGLGLGRLFCAFVFVIGLGDWLGRSVVVMRWVVVVARG